VEAGVLERLAEVFEPRTGIRLIAAQAQQPIDRMHPETDGFHVERGNRLAQRFGLFNKLIAVRLGGEAREGWYQIVDGGKRSGRVI